MKNITNAYLVLSVADIRTMLRAAELEQKARGEARESVTIVLEGITVYNEGPCQPSQIAAWSVNAAVQKSAALSEADLEVFRAGRNASDMAQSVRDALGMNHSDAAI